MGVRKNTTRLVTMLMLITLMSQVSSEQKAVSRIIDPDELTLEFLEENIEDYQAAEKWIQENVYTRLIDFSVTEAAKSLPYDVYLIMYMQNLITGQADFVNLCEAVYDLEQVETVLNAHGLDIGPRVGEEWREIGEDDSTLYESYLVTASVSDLAEVFGVSLPEHMDERAKYFRVPMSTIVMFTDYNEGVPVDTPRLKDFHTIGQSNMNLMPFKPTEYNDTAVDNLWEFSGLGEGETEKPVPDHVWKHIEGYPACTSTQEPALRGEHR